MRFNKPNERTKELINWLFIEVIRAGGDGDGIWYSKYFDIDDLKEFIVKENLLPNDWKIEKRNKHYDHYVFFDGQESLLITNSKEMFENRPSWSQVSIEY